MRPIRAFLASGRSGFSVNPTALSIYNKIVAWWERDEASGTTMTDSHTNALHGTYSGLTVNQSGLAANLNKSVTFPSGNNYAEVPDNALLQLTGNLAIMLWAKPVSSVANFPKLMWKPVNAGSGIANYGFQQDNFSLSGRVVFRVKVSGGSSYDSGSSSILADSTPYCLIGQRNASLLEMWVNGVLENQNNVGIGASALETNTNTLRFGYTTGAGDIWTGGQDQAAVFNAELSGTEIAYLYNSGNGVSYATLKAAAGF